MSRLMADQESRGGDGDSGAGEEDSVMRVNLAEGCGAVNHETGRVKPREMRDRRDPKLKVLSSKFRKPRTSDIESSRLACPASLACLARSGASSCAHSMLFCIRMIVQVVDSARPSFLFRAASWVIAGLCAATLTNCSLVSSRDGETIGYFLPLTVHLRSDPSITGALLTYQNACGQRQSLPISVPLQEMLRRKTGRVFEKVLTGETRSSSMSDGYVDAALGLAYIDLAIPRKANKSYPATVTLGLDFVYTAVDGRVLYSKEIQSIGRGKVEVSEASCEVKGLDTIAQETIGLVTDEMAKQLGTSSKIIDAAEARKAGGSQATRLQSAAAVS